MLRRLPLIVFIFLIALLRNVDCVTFFRNNYKSQFTNPFESIITSFTQAIGSLNDNISYRKSSATQYREKLRKNVMNIFDSFRSSQSVLSQQTQQEFEVYMNQLNQIYSDTLASLQQQRNYIKELEKNVPSRPKQIDESLERFRKFYDESIIHKIVVNPKLENTSISSFKLPPNVVKTIKRPLLKRPSLRIKDLPKSIQINQKYSTKKKKVFQNMKKTIRKYIKSTFNKSNEENIFRDVTRGLEETSASFSHQMDLLGTTLSSQWSYLTHSIQDIVGTDSTGEGGPMGSQLQSQISVLLQEFSTFQDDVSTRANDILKRSQQAIDDSVNKTDLLREKIELEKQLRLLERTVNTWVEDKFTSMEISVKLLQDKLKISNSLYEELVGKRQAEAAYSHLNDETLRRVLSLIDPADEGWKYITSESGAQVYRKFFKSGPSREYACVMCNGTINSPPHKVLALLSDTSRVKEYNSLYENGKEVAEVADNTKILWVTTPPIFPLKPRDFCMVWHVRKLKDGTCIVLNRAVDHPLAPVTRNFVRAEVVLGASIIQPIPGDSRRSRLTMITQLNPGGFAPPTLINFLCTMGPIGYMKNVEVASKRSGARV